MHTLSTIVKFHVPSDPQAFILRPYLGCDTFLSSNRFRASHLNTSIPANLQTGLVPDMRIWRSLTIGNMDHPRLSVTVVQRLSTLKPEMPSVRSAAREKSRS